VKYAFIRAHRKEHKITLMCQVLGVSSSGYYDWMDRPLSPTAKINCRLLTKIHCYHQASFERYGSPRIHQDLLASGEHVSRPRVARLMRAAGLQSKMTKRFVITTDSKNTRAPAPNHLQQDFHTQHNNQAWVSDTTFIRTRQGWLYLAVMLDLYSRQVIGWSMSPRNDSALVMGALTMAVWRRGKSITHTEDIIVHSDQGSTYASQYYQQALKENGMLCSMSRKGECYDNAVAESFFGTLKTELTDDEDYKTREQARQSIFEYIEVFYNRKRRHSYLGYLNPVAFEQQYAA
jgi:transposase InsO family protein